MTSKLIINKYETGKDTQHMEIKFINDNTDEINGKNIIYGPWTNGEKITSVKNQKLIVNIVDINYKSPFNFDLIAKAVKFPSPFHSICDNTNRGDKINNSKSDSSAADDQDNQKAIEYFPEPVVEQKMPEKPKTKIDQISDFLSQKASTAVKRRCVKNTLNVFKKHQYNPNPLDVRLDKIRRNNEKIMQNIMILNKRFNYTRKKEIEESLSAKIAMVSHICDKCGKSFTKNPTFQCHMRQHRIKNEIEDGRDNNSNTKIRKVWLCPYCYQAWPRSSLFKDHLMEGKCYGKAGPLDAVAVHRITTQSLKTHISQLFHCEFCEKLYTSIAKLFKHQKSHGTQKNYECTHCKMIFSSYLNASKHWNQECEWSTSVYTFTMPKYLVCNVCYEKIQDYENLYNHRYEYGHFTIKCKDDAQCEEVDEDNVHVNSRGHQYSNYEEIYKQEVLRSRMKGRCNGRMEMEVVHQCEVCGAVCNQAAELCSHREEGHLETLCQVCGEISDTRANFLSHMKQHKV